MPRQQQPTTKTADVAHYIRAVAPQVDNSRAWVLARGITSASRRFGIEPLLFAAIVRQESNFQPNVKVCYIVVRHHACYATCDYGLAQVNQVQVDRWGLEADRLVEDDAYNLYQGARVLAILKRQFGEDEPNWWSRYNSASPAPRALYETALEPWMTVRDVLFR